MTQATVQTGLTGRLQQIRTIWKQDSWLYGLVGILTGFIFGVAASDVLSQFVTWFWEGFWNEALSIAITVIVLDRLNQLRANEQGKLALIRQAKGRSNDFALDAVEQIQHEGWWEDLLKHYPSDIEKYRFDLSRVQWAGGVQLREVDLQEALLMAANLQGAILVQANLQEADLLSANLQQADLWRANLQGVNLGGANLQRAKLSFTKLQNANLAGANLQEAILVQANLQEVDSWGANLQGANLGGANLQQAKLRIAKLQNANLGGANLRGANLKGAIFDRDTTLPDSKYWTSETDMRRFTDPEHPDFWEPDWVKKQLALDE